MGNCRDCKHWVRSAWCSGIRIEGNSHPVGLRIELRAGGQVTGHARLLTPSVHEFGSSTGHRWRSDVEREGSGERFSHAFYAHDIDWASFWGLPESDGTLREGECKAVGSAEFAEGDPFWTSDCGGGHASLNTREDFGCVQFEPTEPA